eukprot:Skav216515  [mRNA]  locus=scaffold2730:45493:50431:+ [translate_table: standard]
MRKLIADLHDGSLLISLSGHGVFIQQADPIRSFELGPCGIHQVAQKDSIFLIEATAPFHIFGGRAVEAPEAFIVAVEVAVREAVAHAVFS